jgi:sulfur carrier protein
MITALVNGSPLELPPGSTVADVVDRLCAGERGIAVAVDREIVPRSDWAAWQIAEGSCIEVVTAAAGG